jgi:preprotein translocase SecF subunit
LGFNGKIGEKAMFMFHFIQGRRFYFATSAVLVGVSVVVMLLSVILTGAPFGVGVDFQSGTRFEVQFSRPVTEAEIRAVFVAFDVANPSVINLVGEGLTNAWQIRTEFVTPELAQQIEAALGAEVAPLLPETTLVESVSPAVGAEVTQAALIAVLFAAVVILGYMAFAFRQVPHAWRYGACAVSAMFHDLIIVFGFISGMGLLLGWEVDALFVTAVLTVAGFSLQDTIVVFDRMRENLLTRPFEYYEIIVNRSILETVHRSLATQLAAMFVLTALLFFGGPTIRPFIAVLLVGFFSGTYSSIFHAVPLLATWEMRQGEVETLAAKAS